MPSRVTEVIVDCHDLALMASFWCNVLGYEQGNSGDGWVSIGPPGHRVTVEALTAGAPVPLISFVVVPEPRAVKNRVHIDVTPVGVAQEDEVERLLALGATKIDIGQGIKPWIVLADPEGNEFCVMPEAEAQASGEVEAELSEAEVAAAQAAASPLPGAAIAESMGVPPA